MQNDITRQAKREGHRNLKTRKFLTRLSSGNPSPQDTLSENSKNNNYCEKIKSNKSEYK